MLKKNILEVFNYAVVIQFILCLPIILLWRFVFLTFDNRAQCRLLLLYLFLVPTIIFTIRYVYNTFVVLKRSMTGDCTSHTYKSVLQKRSFLEKTISVSLAVLGICVFSICFFTIYKSVSNKEATGKAAILTKKMNTEMLIGIQEDENTVYRDTLNQEHIGTRPNKPNSLFVGDCYTFSEKQYIIFSTEDEVIVEFSIMYLENFPKWLTSYVQKLNYDEIADTFLDTENVENRNTCIEPDGTKITTFSNTPVNQYAVLIETEDDCLLLMMNDICGQIDFRAQEIEEYCAQIVRDLENQQTVQKNQGTISVKTEKADG